MDTPSPSSPNADAYHTNPTAETPPPPPSPKLIRKKKKKPIFKDSAVAVASSSASLGCTRASLRRRNPKVVFAPLQRSGVNRGVGAVEAIALPLGMSFAAVVAQVLERKDAVGERMSVDHLSMICTSAVRESLANIFGDKFDFFARNFQKSFGSTLSTLRLINESSIHKREYHSGHQNAECCGPERTFDKEVGSNGSGMKYGHSDTALPTFSIQNQVCMPEQLEESVLADCPNQEVVLRGPINQLTSAHSSFGSVINQLSMEQARSNDLKTVEIGLNLKKLKLKEAQLALNFDSNYLERSKLDLNKSKTSFKVEKFKTQLEDTRHAELLKSCMDCLVAGLFIMSASLLYGAYIFSHRRITEATASCSPSQEESRSWWIPRPFSSINSELHTLRCQVQVVSRMLFGILMILAVGYLLLQRSGTSQQANPITFILLLLAAACGFAGKLCVDTLGGNGAQWLLYWETLCLLQFISNFWISTCFYILYGPVDLTHGIKNKAVCPYWFRRFLFYATMLLILPLCCGLLPFANPVEWKDHFMLLSADFLSIRDD